MIIAGTGHRPDKLGGYSSDINLKLIDVVGPWLEKNKPKKVISGMALGFDSALAEAALYLHIPLIVAIPFFGQETKWPKESQTKYNDILSNAVDKIYVCDQGYAPWKMQIRNEWMVDHCDILLALWNGSSGGTSNCIEYAKKKNKSIVNLWNDWHQDN